jgi:hypothetical protein
LPCDDGGVEAGDGRGGVGEGEISDLFVPDLEEFVVEEVFAEPGLSGRDWPDGGESLFGRL